VVCAYAIDSEADDGIATIIIVVVIIPLFILAVTIVPVSKAVKRRCNKNNHHKQSTIPLEFDYQVPGKGLSTYGIHPIYCMTF